MRGPDTDNYSGHEECTGQEPEMTKTAVTRQTIGILIVEDHEVVRLGLRYMIEKQPHMKIVGEATNQADALAIASREKP